MMLLMAAALLGTATVQSAPVPTDAEALLACAADRYRAARLARLSAGPAAPVVAKGLGGMAPVGPERARAQRLEAEGDALRARAGTSLDRAAVIARYGKAACTGR
jgi:hypothetical protein